MVPWLQLALATLAGVLPGLAAAQTAQDVFPAVVFLRGNYGIETTEIRGKTYEVWIRDPAKKHPEPAKRESTGTGFVVQRGGEVFLVTASHVVKGIPLEASATLMGPNSMPLEFPLSDLASTKPPRWDHHADADVAILRLAPPRRFSSAIKAVSFDALVASLSAPDLDHFLTTVGFPLRLGVSGKFSPITKVSHPSSGLFTYPRFDTKDDATFFILDDSSVAGFSGAPVFKLPKVKIGVMSSGQGAFECVGVVHGTFSDSTGGKFAAIVPAFYVTELIEKAAPP